MTELEVRNLSMRYERKYILHDLNLKVEQGDLVVILGESGCGKTSLLKIIAGILEHEKGEIFIDGKDVTNLLPQKRNIGYVPQGQILFPHMKIKDNILFGLKAKKYTKGQMKEKLSWIAKLTEIEDLLDRYPHEISGGQKQRVSLARSLVTEPKILLLDEPLSSIDASGREALALTIRRVQKETGTTTLYVTHNQEEARLIGDKVAIMYDGKIQQMGKIIDVDKNPLNYLTAKIMGSLNVYPVLYYTEKSEKQQITLETTIGEVRIPFPETGFKKKITGIKISPSLVKIKQEKKKTAHKRQNIILKGSVKSVIEIGENLYRIVTEIEGNTIEYIKIDTRETNVVQNLNADQQIVLEIQPEHVIVL